MNSLSTRLKNNKNIATRNNKTKITKLRRIFESNNILRLLVIREPKVRREVNLFVFADIGGNDSD